MNYDTGNDALQQPRRMQAVGAQTWFGDDRLESALFMISTIIPPLFHTETCAGRPLYPGLDQVLVYILSPY